MGLHKITLGSLYGRRYLDLVDISRLDLCLHQKIQDTVKFLTNDSKISDLVLNDDRLLIKDPTIFRLLKTLYLKKRAVPVSDLSSFLIIMPVVTRLIIWNLSDINPDVPVLFFDPSENVIRRIERVFCCCP